MRRRHLLVVPAAGLLVGTLVAPVAVAQSDDARLVHRESILSEVDATGAVGTSRVFTQLTVPAGTGEVVLPGQSISGLRGLSGSGPSVDGDTLRFDGSGTIRTVATSTAELPVSLEIRYAIDGEQVQPSEVLGHDGEVAVTYVVRNLTAEPTELTLVDGDGQASTQTVDVAVPMVGSLALTLPDAFGDVTAPGAVVVGDGRGGTVVSWSLLLFSPLGSETQEVTWTARASDAIVPPASLQVLPVTPDSFGSLGSTEAAYAGAVDSTTELAEGAREIDANLRRLATGAGTLLAGLTQLRDGANDLATGLVGAVDGAGDLSDGLGAARAGASELTTGLGDLATGATALSDGLGAARAGGTELAAGLGQLSTGANDLASGAGELATGATTLDARAGELVAGAGQLSTGASQVLGGIQLLASSLSGSDGLPSAIAGIVQLRAGIGAIGAEGTLLDGLDQVADGLADARSGVGQLRGGVGQVEGGLGELDLGLQQLAGGLSGLREGIGGIAVLAAKALEGDAIADPTARTYVGQIAAATTPLTGGVDALLAGVGTPGADDTLRNGVAELQGGMDLIDTGLAELSAGIGSPTATGTLRNGVARITAGVSNPACDPADPTNAANPCGVLEGLAALRSGLEAAAGQVSEGLGSPTAEGSLLWGATQVVGGSGQLAAGASQLRSEGTTPLAAGAGEVHAGATQLAAGAASALSGAEDLTDGLGRLVGGGLELADGATRAAAGGVELGNGLVQLDEGGAQLATGLGAAVDGSQQLADGLSSAVAGGQEVADGAEQLGDEGTAVLAGSVSDATRSSSLDLEHVRAVAARGVAGDGLPYPTAEGAEASAVYQFDLAGVGSTDGPGAVGRFGIGAIALALGLGAVIGSRRRRVLVLPDVEAPTTDRITV